MYFAELILGQNGSVLVSDPVIEPSDPIAFTRAAQCAPLPLSGIVRKALRYPRAQQLSDASWSRAPGTVVVPWWFVGQKTRQRKREADFSQRRKHGPMNVWKGG